MDKNEKLLYLLQYVKEHNPYYKNTLANEQLVTVEDAINCLANMKPINKDILLNHYEELISDEINPDDLLWEYTSGTTGKPLKIGKTVKERSEAAFKLMKWRKKHFGVQLAENYAYFTTIAKDKKYVIDRNILFMSEINLDDESFDLYYELMVEKKVKWMFSTPSVTYLLMNYLKRNNKEIPSLRYIELTGEQMLPEEKAKFSEFFKCNVAEQYGIRELWAIAKECKEGQLHLLENDILLENCGSKGIYVTALNQYAMPIIKYYVEDEIEEGPACICGCSYKTIKIKKSRALEFLFIGKDRVISPILLRICLTRIKNQYGINIGQFQYIQDEYDGVKCYIQYDDNYSVEEIKEKLVEAINQLYPLPEGFNVTVIKVDSLLPAMKRGKLGYFISHLKKVEM